MYRTIKTSIWCDPKIKKLTLQEKYLFIYLITNHHAHMSGIYYLSLTSITADTSLSEGDLRKALHRLATVSDLPQENNLDGSSMPYEYPIDGDSSIGLVFYDFNFEVVWVRNMLKHQGNGDKIKKGVENHLESLHKCPLIKVFSEYYSSIKWGNINTPSIPYDIPHRYKEQKQQKKQKKTKISKIDSHDESSGIQFERFWVAYPRKKQKAQAQKIWAKQNLDEKADVIIADVINRSQKDSQWQNHQFIPHPTNYLRNEGWKDEITINQLKGGMQNGERQRVNKSDIRQNKIIEAEREYVESRNTEEY